MIFKMSFQWKKSECISQTKQFFYIFLNIFKERWSFPLNFLDLSNDIFLDKFSLNVSPFISYSKIPYLLNRERTWNHLKPAETSWNHPETTWNHLKAAIL